MSLCNLSQVLIRNIDMLACQQAILVNFPIDYLYQEWLSEHEQCKLHYFTNNRLIATQANNINHPAISTSFGTHYQGEDKFDLAVIAFPKSKAELAYSLAMLAPHLTHDAQLLFVGENKGGIKSAAKLSEAYVQQCKKIDSARHCSLFSGSIISSNYRFNLDDWYHIYPLNIGSIKLSIAALPGVFSQQGLDKGTQVLLENLPTNYQGKVLDFGCGAGVISAYLASTNKAIEILGLDISALAVASTNKTLALNNFKGSAIASDGLTELNTKFDHIVSNPPFHQGLKTYYTATETFLKTCTQYLVANGQVTIVANSFLKYLPILKVYFKKALATSNQNGFTVYHAMKNQ